MADRDFVSIADKTHQSADDLRGTQRTFYFPLVVPNKVKSFFRDSADPVKHQDTRISSIENHIIFSTGICTDRFNQSLIPSRQKHRIHTVALGMDTDDITVFQKLFQIDLAVRRIRLIRMKQMRLFFHNIKLPVKDKQNDMQR